MEFIDGEQAATLLTEVDGQVSAARAAVESGLKGESGGLSATKSVAHRAAALLERLRFTLRRWYGLYDGYDPKFTWRAEAPEKSWRFYEAAP